jgi:hypothetical protein
MLKIFRAKKTTEQIIAEIHNDFDTASERLLQEAKEIIGSKDTGKADRLRQLGFTKSLPVKETEEMRKTQMKSKWLAERVAYFSQWYPHNKFITEEAVEVICNKYGLVFADAGYYKGDVPEKNLREMEQFTLRKEDMTEQPFDFGRAIGLIQSRMAASWDPFGRSFVIDWGEPGMGRGEETVNPKAHFKICAPESDFDMTLLTKKGHKLELNIPDPIVLQPVQGGYLIVTKWGLEASDDLVKNEKSN